MKKQIVVLLFVTLLFAVTVLPVTGVIVENQMDDKMLLEGNDLTEDELVETKKIVDNSDNPPFIVNGKYDEGSNLSVNDNVDYEYIERDRIIEIALGYLNHEWYPMTENIFHDKYMGWQVDTPDRDTYTERPDEWGWKSNQLNIGIPYQWGGFSSISGFNLSSPYDFDEQYTGTGSYDGVIHYGGDIYTNKNYNRCLKVISKPIFASVTY